MRFTMELRRAPSPNDACYEEWWEVKGGNLVFRCSNDVDADWLCNVLNAANALVIEFGS